MTSVCATRDAGNDPGVTPAQSTIATSRPRSLPGVGPETESCDHCASTCAINAPATASKPSLVSAADTALSLKHRWTPPVYALLPPWTKTTSSNRRRSFGDTNRYFSLHRIDRSIAAAARETSPWYCSKNAACCARVKCERVSGCSELLRYASCDAGGHVSSAPNSLPVRMP